MTSYTINEWAYDPNIEYAWTPLMLACRNSRTVSSEKVVKLLINSRADLDLKDNDGRTALMFACGNSSTDSSEYTVELLINARANLNLQDNDGLTALMISC